MFKIVRKIVFLPCLSSMLFALNDLELHNTDKAHRLGITGQNIIIGINDDAFNENHQNLQGKVLQSIYPKNTAGQQQNPNITTNTHGSHVAGIALGKKLGNDFKTQPYGVAYNAKFYGAGIFPAAGYQNYTAPTLYNFFQGADIKIINNSWGNNIYPVVELSANTGTLIHNTSFSNPTTLINGLRNASVTGELMRLTREKQVLNIFAAGNEGIISPNVPAVLPYYDEELRAWLTVGALDSAYITRANDGTLNINPQGIALFGNSLKGASNFSLVAAGISVNNVNSATNSGYTIKSGTSMATPVVSGAAALVSERFPFLNGKQIADVLLSTANKNYQVPKMTLKRVQHGNNVEKYLVLYIDTQVPTSTAQIQKDVEDYYANAANKTALVNQVMANLETLQGATNGALSITREELFGQGILDTYKALGGIAILDANRLKDSDVQTYKTENQAVYYTLNTDNFDAEFSNDIAQRKWEDSKHLNTALNKPNNLANLNVGFTKEGRGILTLSGANSYEGATIIKEGEIKLDKKNGKGSLASNVYVENAGKLSGNGVIQKDLYNEGTVRAGNNDLKDLTIQGKYTQTQQAFLQLEFGNQANSKLIANNYDILGGKLQYIPLKQFYTTRKLYKMELGTLGAHLDKFNGVEFAQTSSLSFPFTLEDDKLSINKPNSTSQIVIIPTLKDQAYEVPNSTMGDALRQIRSLNIFSNNQATNKEYEDFFANLDASSPSETNIILKSLEGNAYLDTTSTLFNAQSKAVQSNMLLSLNPFNQQAYNAFAQEPTLLASGMSDLMLDYGIKEEKSIFWHLAPNLKRYTGNQYTGYAYGFDLGFATQPFEQTNFATSVNLTNSSLDFDGLNLRSNNVNFSFNSLYDFEFFKVLAGLNTGFSFNRMQRELLGNGNRNAKYYSLLNSLQLGLAKDFLLHSFTFTPLSYFSYNHLYQNSFKEKGGIFAKQYNRFHHNFTSLTGGFTLTYDTEGANFYSRLSSFLLYEHRLSGKNFDNEVRFRDFSNQGFTQRSSLDKNLINLGLSAELIQTNSVFFKLAFVNEFSKRQYNINVLGSFGKGF
ncbi:S8 family serine peptidase [Campylobacter sp. MIT 21-1685]|uniref:S8 family serine peptidase n=1 Tax=unclassified Campylobacter TaxID=2593542 RepID=UPI00224B29A3|nr:MULTISPECIES: S8 family serine peptidase [unclassified Campylobacter]MCX2683171.1 S8 family serine peptidase [Campylobacter sp. MIT 21-1684]MCX2751509.1 S8 family serine peptidase [Campylobacter sp. MIT 21-1682]MCX2807652.1 S8 family serine peptidase [Campylobacter sp. MIT 21-1685]